MDISLLTMLLSHLDLLPYLKSDVTQEVKIVNSSASGSAKLQQTLTVIEDLAAQIKATMSGQPIPAPQSNV